MTEHDQGASDEPRTAVDTKMMLEEAHAIAKRAQLRIVNKRGVFVVYRNTVPKLTYVGARVDAESLLALVRRAAQHDGK